MSGPHSVIFAGADGNRLVGDRYGSSRSGMTPVILLHGGGQTRHAWRSTARRLADGGFATAIAFDQRGHGDSEWPDSGGYEFEDFARDLIVVADVIAASSGQRPVLIGASLGGIAAMLAEGNANRSIFSSLVLVDVTPRMEPGGVTRILQFMSEHLKEGFATIEEAADAVAAYLPNRPRPRSLDGLRRHLRHGADGRWRWHWDPRFLEPQRHDAVTTARLADAASRLALPTLLVRGGQSELVHEDHARDFLALVPSAGYVDVSGAGHMVAGDRNDAFADAIIAFLGKTIAA